MNQPAFYSIVEPHEQRYHPMNKFSATLLAVLLICQPLSAKVSDRARQIAQDSLIIDGHIDVPYRLQRNFADVSKATKDGQFDYPRAVKGGLNAPFMSIYIPASEDEAGNAIAFADESMALVEAIANDNPDKFAVATCTQDLIEHQQRGLISLPMGMENGGPISGEIDNLQRFFDKGIRYITLTHSKSNHISDSSYDENEAWQGLSDFGKTLIREMNRLGVMVDVSHITDAAFWQALAISKAPMIASHSSLRHFTPGFHRNMSDAMVKALGERGGVIQINFGSGFLTTESRAWSTTRTQAATAYAQANELEAGDPALMEFVSEYRNTNPYPFADLDDVLDHIDRAVELAGIDAVGIGSDYDGVGDTLPTGLKDVSTFPNLVQGLLDRGYSEADIRKILGGNVLRVWREVEAYAESQGTATQCRSSQRTVSAPVADDEFHFVVLGDAQFHEPAKFNRTVDHVRHLRPAFVIQVGDLIQGYNSDLTQIRDEWARFKRQIQPLGPVRYYPVPGNHDVYGGDKLPDAKLETLFEQEMGPLYYSFTYRNALIVALNSDTREAMGYINDEQLDWLRDVLASSTAKHRFVFMHRPPILMENFERLHKMLAAFGVSQVFYGHHHHFHNVERDGVNYTMTNASGRLGHANPLIGGLHGFLQVAVRGEEVDVAMIKADSVLAQNSVAPADNYDFFSMVLNLAPDEVTLKRRKAGEYRLDLPLHNSSRRDITVYASCTSADGRWQFDPARQDVLTLAADTRKTLKIKASFADNRQPESTPQCQLRVPVQTASGDWTHYDKQVTTLKERRESE